MQPRDHGRVGAPLQAMVVDQARRASAARALAAVFLVLSALASATLLYLPAPPGSWAILLVSAAVFAGIWWFAREPARASQAGAALVATQLTVDVVMSALMSKPLEQVQVAYQTALLPLIAAATLRASGVIATGAAGALALVVEVALHWSPDAYARFVSPAFYFAAAWVVATFSSIASHRSLRAHADEERRTQSAQAAAQLAEARYQLVAEHVSDLVSLFDAEGRYLYASPSYAHVLGVEPSKLVGQRSPELVHEEDLPLLQAAFLRALDGETVSLVARLRAASGDYRWFHVGLSGVSGLPAETGERGVAVSARDITEQRELSEALEKTRRMEALGNLAGGVAHDFNNLLMVVQSCTDLVASQLPPGHAAHADLGDVGGAVQRAAALTQQLLTFARRQVLPAAQSAIVAQTTNELAPILARLCGKNIRFELDARGSSLAVDANAVQLEQVLMNLAANACDAMPQGGKLSVIVRDRSIAEGEAPGLSAGRYVELTVTDTGSGMSAELQERIFEPFFTTKPAGRGTGLGLATVFGLVSQLHGRITVRSTPGAGSTFTVLLPESRHEPALRAAPQHALPRRSLDVLVVDDEAGVRALVARMLTNAGHRVTEADSVETATAAVESAAHFDAIVTDVVIGSGDGVRMLERVRAAQPGAGVVVMSGFSPSPERVAALTAQGAEFLAKPFAASELHAALERAHVRVAGSVVQPSEP
jgi:PAS domain S-box-containing protein